MRERSSAGSVLILTMVVAVAYLWLRSPRMTACSEEKSRVPSPTKEFAACLVDRSESLTQVMVDFPKGLCGAGAVAAAPKGVAFQLRWRDAVTLEVAYPAGAKIEGDASFAQLQCRSQKVSVVLVERR